MTQNTTNPHISNWNRKSRINNTSYWRL